MQNDKIQVATGVWYRLAFGHRAYLHFPGDIQYDINRTNGHKYISALESCKPISSESWGADYDILNGAKPRLTRELINLTRDVCDDFLDRASGFAEIKLPMISMSIKRLVTGSTCYQGKKGHMHIDQDYDHAYNFIYSKANCLVTPSNISDILGKEIKHIHTIYDGQIFWDTELNPDTPLYVYNYDKYYEGGAVYARILDSDTDVVNEKLCLISPNKTGHTPSQIAELFQQKTAPTIYYHQTRRR